MSFTASQETMDPNEILDWKVDFTPVLDSEEGITSYSIAIPAESLLYGLTLGSGQYASYITGSVVTFWLSMTSPPPRAVQLPVEITITTNSTPPRIKQRTVAIKVDSL